MTEQEIVIMAAEVAAKAAVAAVRAILGKEIQESVEAAVTDAARLGAEASIKAVEQERKKFRDGRSDRRFRNTKLLLRNYTVLNANCSHAVYDAASAATGEESVEEIVEALDELLEENLKVESIMKSAARTQLIMRHVNRMREAAEVEKVVTVPAPESFKDENGKVIQLEVKVLSSERIRAINEGYHTHTVALDKKGNPYINGGNVVFRDERDNAKATRHILVEALQYPKLDDPELMKYYNCVDITQMPEKVFSRADEFAHVTRVVMALLGIGGQLSEEEQKQADEKEIDDAKN